MKTLLISFVRDDCGQNLVEYALLAALVALVALTALTNIGKNVGGVFTTIANTIAGQ